MRQLLSSRRRILQGLLGVALAGLGVRQVAADEKHGGHAPSGISATWKHRWHDGLRSHRDVAAPKDLPADYVPIGGQKHKTQHWVRPKDWPVGPAIQTLDGEITSVDFRIAKADFDRGFSWSLPVPEELRRFKIDHVDIDLVPAKESPLKTAHYDVHLYFVHHGAHGACDL
jgi:hypothetical protein